MRTEKRGFRTITLRTNLPLYSITVGVLSLVSLAETDLRADGEKVPYEWQSESRYRFSIKKPLVGLDFWVKLDEEEKWPRILRELQVDTGRHYDAAGAWGPEASRRWSPIDFGMVRPIGGTEAKVVAYTRSWNGYSLSVIYEGADDIFLKEEETPLLTVYVNRLSPGVLIRARSDLRLFAGMKYRGTSFPKSPRFKGGLLDAEREAVGFVLPSYCAVSTRKGVIVRPLTDISEIPLDGLYKSWMLVWFGKKSFFRGVTRADLKVILGFGGEKVWKEASYVADCPMLILFGSQPLSIEVETDEARTLGLSVRFDTERSITRSVVIIPILGELLPEAERTERWKNGLPNDVIKLCNWWSKHMDRFPIRAYESYAYDEKSQTVTIRERFEYIGFRSAGSYCSPVPPAIGTAVLEGFRVEFSTKPYDTGLVTSVGSYLAVPGVDSYEMRFPGIGKYLQPLPVPSGQSPRRLVRILHNEVEKVVSAGHLAPWLVLYKNCTGWSYGYFMASRNLVHANSGETLYILAQTLTFLNEELREKCIGYLKNERYNYPPEAGLLPRGAGAQREAYQVSKRYIKGMNSQRRNNFYIRQKLIPPETIYYLSAYYDAVREDSPEEDCKDICLIDEPYLERTDWATGTTFQWPGIVMYSMYRHTRRFPTDVLNGLGGIVDLNNRFAGSVGKIRLARLAKDGDTERMAWGEFARIAALRFSLGKMTQHLYKRGLLTLPPQWERPECDIRLPLVMDEYGMTLTEANTGLHMRCLTPLGGVVPELGVFARDFLRAETERYYSVFERNIPHWYFAWVESTVRGESNCARPEDAYQTFLAHAWVLGSSPQWLEKHLDVPWHPRGDLFYIHKIVETIRAYSSVSSK